MIGKNIRGIIPPIITPFDVNEELDESLLRKEVRYLFNAGVHGVSFGGSTGEGALLSDDELVRGIKIIKEENTFNIPVLCGIIRNSTRDAVRAGLAAKKAGADALMITPTFYHGTNDKGNYEFFKTIGETVGLPIVIYNVIKNNSICPSTMLKLCEIKEIVGIKQSVGGIHSLTDMISVCGSKTLVFGAQDDLLFASYLLGAVGAISAILTVFPELCVKQWNAVQEGDINVAKEIHYSILLVWRRIEGGAFPGKIKATLKLLNRNVGKARSPILEPDEEELLDLKEVLINSGLIK